MDLTQAGWAVSVRSARCQKTVPDQGAPEGACCSFLAAVSKKRERYYLHIWSILENKLVCRVLNMLYNCDN